MVSVLSAVALGITLHESGTVRLSGPNTNSTWRGVNPAPPQKKDPESLGDLQGQGFEEVRRGGQRMISGR